MADQKITIYAINSEFAKTFVWRLLGKRKRFQHG